MKAWLCLSCRRVLFISSDHRCPSAYVPRSGPSEKDEKMPAVGVPHVASVRKWCEK